MLYPDLNELISYKELKLFRKRQTHRLSSSMTFGEQGSPFKGQGLEFDSVRKYVPGDDIRNIDWRVTARTGIPHLKIFQEERQRQIFICVDMNSAMRFGTRKTFKSVQAAHIAAVLGWQGKACHDRVSACLFGDVPGGIEFFNSKPHTFSLFLKRLSDPVISTSKISFKKVFEQMAQVAPPGSLIYFISDFMEIGHDPEEEAFLNRMRRNCDLVFISVNDRADYSLFPVGLLEFQGHLEEKLFINTDNEEGREAYELQWRRNRKKLAEIASRFKLPLIELTTESDVAKALHLALKQKERK